MRGGCGGASDDDEPLGGGAAACTGDGSCSSVQARNMKSGGGCAGLGNSGSGGSGVGGCVGQGSCGGGGSGGGGGCGGGERHAGESAAGAGSWKVNQPHSKDEAAATASGTCIKCNAAPATVVINHKEHVCGECMDERITGKARGPLLRTGLVQAGDSILVALSGGPGSWTALHVLRGLQSSNTQRPERGRVPLTLGIVHVDESSVFDASPAPALAAEAGAGAEPGAEPGAEALQERQQQQEEGAVGRVIERWAAEHLPGARVHRLRLEDVFLDKSGAATAAADDDIDDDGLCDDDDDDAVGDDAAGSSTTAACSGNGSASSTQPQQQQQQQRRRRQLSDLLASVRDATGREDLVAHLRRWLLLRTAAAHGYGTLALGTTATATAVAVVAGAAKGRGYALPGDLQAWDARYGPGSPKVLHPLRALSAAEALLLCERHALPLCSVSGGAAHSSSSSTSNGGGAGGGGGAAAATNGSKSINELARRFVESMQAAVPSSTHTIVRTAGKLQAFPWNAPPERRRRDGQPPAAGAGAEAAAGAGDAELLCAVCAAPLTEAEAEAAAAAAAAAVPVCRSCSLDIIGGPTSDGASETWRLLPHGMRSGGEPAGGAGGRGGQEALRQQIAEFLIEDDGDQDGVAA